MPNVSVFAGLTRMFITESSSTGQTTLIEGISTATASQELDTKKALSGTRRELAELNTVTSETLTVTAEQIPPSIHAFAGNTILKNSVSTTYNNTNQLLSYNIEQSSISARRGNNNSILSFYAQTQGEGPGMMTFLLELTESSSNYTYSKLRIYKIDGTYAQPNTGDQIADIGFLNGKLLTEIDSSIDLSNSAYSISVSVDGVAFTLTLNKFSDEEKSTDIGKFSQGNGGVTTYVVTAFKGSSNDSVTSIFGGGTYGETPRVSLLLIGEMPTRGAMRTTSIPEATLAPLPFMEYNVEGFSSAELVFTLYPSTALSNKTWRQDQFVIGG